MADPDYILDSYQDIKNSLFEVDELSRQELLQLQKETIETHLDFSKKYPRILENIVAQKSLESIVQQIIVLQKNPELLTTPHADVQQFTKKYPNVVECIREKNSLQLLKNIREVYKWFDVKKQHLFDKGVVSRSQVVQDLEEKHYKFNNEYPKLFEGIVNKTLEDETLEYMIKMLRKMKQENLSEHDASVDVGTHLVEKFVKPNLEK
tara:strand:+ start:107 stop:727 length:621 start_codon:yes stop_codon:yes gene_type:complete